MTTETVPTSSSPSVRSSTATPNVELVQRAIDRRSFCTLSTCCDDRPHAAGVIYAPVDGMLYVSTLRTSRKARDIAQNARVHVCIEVRRLPVGPPASIQFTATAELLGLDDPEIVRLARTGRLKAITGHGELELDGGCFVRIMPSRTIHTYGLGLSLRRLIKDPLAAGGSVVLPIDSGRPPAARS